MAKSKRFDVKALLLNHGEKLGVGLIALLGVTGLATANWEPSSGQPDDLRKLAETTRSTWQSQPFKDDRKAAFEDTPDVLALAERMQSETEDQERFLTINQWNPPIHRVRERRGAVTVLRPVDPEISTISIVMAEKPDAVDEETQPESEPEKSIKSQEPEVGSDVKNTFGVAGTGLTGPGGLAGAGAGPGGMPTRGPGIGGRRDKDYDDLAEEGLQQMGFGAAGYSSYAGMDAKVHYYSGVSVRMIFPLLEQIRSVSESLHLPQNDPQVSQAIDFHGFQIERKRAISGADPWSGEWESISTDEIGEILEKSFAFDLEVVNPSVTRSELTMPLPRLAAGQWTPADASHSKLEDFKLDEEEQQLLDRYQAKLLEEAERQKKLMPDPARKGGFARFMLNSSDLSRQVDGAPELTNQLFSEIEMNSRDRDGKDRNSKSKYENKEELKKLISRSMSTGRVLLVRFMDFTCARGNSYIYRVRLIMKNPNFNYPVDALEQPELATKEYIYSDWSDATVPAYVPQSYRYYTQRADNPQSVKIGMFYENEPTGTPVMANLDVRVGSRIGGKTKVEVVDLAKSVLEPQDVELKSPDLLAAVAPSIRVNGIDSPELKAYVDSMRGQGKPLADRITVIDSNGAILARYAGDSVTNGGYARTENQDAKFYQDILKLYEHLKYDATAATAGVYEGEDEDGKDRGGRGMMRGTTGGGGYGGQMRGGSSLSGNGRGGKGARRKANLVNQ